MLDFKPFGYHFGQLHYCHRSCGHWLPNCECFLNNLFTLTNSSQNLSGCLQVSQFKQFIWQWIQMCYPTVLSYKNPSCAWNTYQWTFNQRPSPLFSSSTICLVSESSSRNLFCFSSLLWLLASFDYPARYHFYLVYSHPH